ncbi:MAG: hypothetical protein M3M94_06980 [Actinomycetota bacterium]|nr:hypothetical protein [Actinomycetota bacterium]
MEFLGPLVMLAVAGLYLQAIRQALPPRGWREEWQALPRDRRERIESAVRQGKAVDDDDDVSLALALIDHSERFLGGFIRPRAVVLEAALAPALVLAARSVGIGWRLTLVFAGGIGAGFLLTLAMSPFLKREIRRLRAARAANAELAARAMRR